MRPRSGYRSIGHVEAAGETMGSSDVSMTNTCKSRVAELTSSPVPAASGILAGAGAASSFGALLPPYPNAHPPGKRGPVLILVPIAGLGTVVCAMGTFALGDVFSDVVDLALSRPRGDEAWFDN